MSIIQWLLAVLRKLHLGALGSTLAQLSSRALFTLLSAVSRVIIHSTTNANRSQITPRASDNSHGETSSDDRARVDRETHHASRTMSSNLTPTSLSHSSQDSITQEAYPPRSSPTEPTPATRPVLTPERSTDLGPGDCSPSTDFSVVETHRLSTSGLSSGVSGDGVRLTSLLSEGHPRVFPETPDNVDQPLTGLDNYVPHDYHFRSDSESDSGLDSDDAEAESVDFDPSLMVNPPIIPQSDDSFTRQSHLDSDLSTLNTYPPSARRASRSSQDIAMHVINQESSSLPSLSVQDLPTTWPTEQPPTTLSVQHLPVLPPPPNLGTGCPLPSSNAKVVHFDLPGPAPSRPHDPSQPSSGKFNALAASLPVTLSEEHPRMLPGIPDSVDRYDRKIAVPNEPTQFTIPPLSISYLPNTPPSGWTVCLHPEGAQYFFNKEKRVFTDTNLFNNGSLMFIEINMDKIYDFLRAHGVHLAADVDLVLNEYLYSDKSKGCAYYFINHQDRCVFWMDEAQSELFSVTQELNGITSSSHIKHELEAQYWRHCELFPRSLEVTHEIVGELREIALHSLGDLITASETSTVSWKLDELDRMINLIDCMSKNVGKPASDRFGGSSCLVGRLMCLFVRGRVYNFHGEPGARLNVDQSVYGTIRKRTFLITLLSPLLFYAPDFHLVSLHKIYTDKLIRHRGWAEFVTRLNDEWKEFTLSATVMLNANVAFLSIQSVDQGGFSLPDRTPAQISSYLSTLMSIGSVIIGLLLLKQNRNPDRVTAEDASQFIFRQTHPTLGLEPLAVLYAVPYSMLMWSMVSFLAAFSFMCFENSSLVTRTLVGVLWAAVAVLILWCIINAWERTYYWGWLWRLFYRCKETGPAEDRGDVVEEEANTVESRSRTRWWTSIARLCRRSYDSEQTVPSV
ncbi:hypothetical protein B0H17DRAFT_301858 [Mycena rosella]|uniref:WW domain-containing protein n=1 Tax=Mycena rosella TaxID=1033263 RepID=A0AAD7CUP4_MYCRO|nr:hypothetical protein B0H17DRAFT_301858 [Mycena rosella]